MGLKNTVSSLFGADAFVTTKLDSAVGWMRKYSIFVYPFVTACCGMSSALAITPSSTMARTYMPGSRFRSGLGKTARRVTEPVP